MLPALLPGAVHLLEAAHSLEGGMPVHEEALSLANHRVARQFLSCHAMTSALLRCLVPVLQIAPGQASLHTAKLLTSSIPRNSSQQCTQELCFQPAYSPSWYNRH